MLETVQKPYEFLARWDDDGQFQGAHAVFIECTVVDGVVIAKKLGVALTPQQAADLDFPFEDVLGQALTDSLVLCSQHEATIATLEREKVTLNEAHAAEIQAKDANLQALLGEVSVLKEEGAAMKAALTEAEQAANAGFFTKLANLFTK